MCRSPLWCFWSLLSVLLLACQPTLDAPISDSPTPPTTTNEETEVIELIDPEDVDLRSCSAGVNAMAFNLWRAIDDLPDNAAISPTSISLAMSMVLAGARGDTAAELASALGVEPDEETHRCWAGMLMKWEKAAESDDLELAIANRLFGHQGLPFEDDYIEFTRSFYRSALTPLNLRGQPEPSRQAINQWVEEATRERIQDLLPPRSIDSNTTLVLVNAIYLLAKWEQAFSEDRTRPGTFTRTDQTTKQVPMMHQRAQFPYAAVDGHRLLELPYGAGGLSMVILLPEAVDGLPALEERLDPALLSSWMERLHPTEVEVVLPRFTIEETSVQLVPAFRTLGVSHLFGAADLSAIIQGEPTTVSGIFHKTFVEVDEAGTEAAAATAVVVSRSAAAPSHPVFSADRPFFFLILDQQTETILFMGRVNDP